MKVQKITIEEVIAHKAGDAKKDGSPRNLDFLTVRLSTPFSRGTASAVSAGQSFLLGGGAGSKASMFTSIHKDSWLALGGGEAPEVGADLNALMAGANQPAVRLTVKEVDEAGFNKLADQSGWNAKTRGKDGVAFTSNGSQVYFNTFLTSANEEDDLLTGDAVTADAKAKGAKMTA